MPNINENFVKNLKYYMNLRGKNQTDLAKYIDVSNTTITNYMTGANMPRMDKIDKICQFLLIKRSDLLEDKEKDEEEEEMILIARDLKTLTKEQQDLIKSMIRQFKNE
ncbi:MAG: helix-turn-helix transcriptional regulator [Eubacteriales bacterium]|uniref:helix-turn-helix domain-containing protein n=1 Tax=Fenollaria sp. TaxID=1965292 RepID=UPI002A75AEF0|nr:helix-turn-helix transcriptional regulator [Fenollaria sp.]MDD7339758.1 helix-turn-helix transcriptional regulator [Eubacteriales bacterium]MDY3106346.1 helix-turn-helix transcriptional regulator [Fenollaria sp.]